MSDRKEPVSPVPNIQQLDEDRVFHILGDPLRRKLLVALVRKSSQTASDLHKPRPSYELNNSVKHLRIMRDAGVVTVSANSADGRRALYSLSPAMSAVVSQSGGAFNFRFPSFSAEVSLLGSSSPTKHGWSEDFVFDALAEPVRRRLLLALARGGPQPAVNLQGAGGRTRDDTLKRLGRMRTDGLVTLNENPKGDRRRGLYALTPKVPLIATESGKVIDFGCCVLRLV